MNRLWLGLGILVLFLALSLWCGWVMGTFHADLAQQMEEASQTALAGDLEKAVATADRVQQRWQAHWKGTAALADHAPMEEIESLFAQLEAYGQASRAADFAAYSARLSRLLHATGEAHVPVWWNLL